MEVASELSPLSGAENQGKIVERSSYYPQEPSKRPQTAGQKMRSCLKHNALTLLTVGGVVGGVVLGIILRNSREKWTPREIMYIGYFGDLFLRMLKSLILPLIVSSLVSAIGSLDLSLSGKIGVRAIGYYMITTILAVILGIILVSSIRPGEGRSAAQSTRASQNVSTADTLMDLVRNMFPPNLVEACIFQHRTEMKRPKDNPNAPFDEWKPEEVLSQGSNILGLVVFATVMGITLGKMGSQTKPLLNFFEALSGAMMVITKWVIWLSPLGVLSLVAAKITEIESLDRIVSQLGMYFLTVLIALLIHGLLILPGIYFLFTKKNPYSYISNMAEALVTAFGTSSSSATLPLAIDCLESKNGIDPHITRFVMPIGATVNMDGTALYEAVAAIFIAQVRNISVTFGQLIAISITATAASIGAAGIPQAGLVTMVMVLDTVRLPANDVYLILAVDWLLDRCRTTVNVIGDSLGAGIVQHLSRNELTSLSHNTQQAQNGADCHATTSI
ncbi:excitatory amino acid transporter 1 isoform X2 [Monomorium pharaonis]|uniref:excitatory amino acid transporter 1 isoform X2 n=1 Tax=Monomorium pharaonis TaxID=307658 RepID=UPI00063F9AFF|nr:excitatory amino acid transporter 1 isoform X2 [Monomorium pharaonis]